MNEKMADAVATTGEYLLVTITLVGDCRDSVRAVSLSSFGCKGTLLTVRGMPSRPCRKANVNEKERRKSHKEHYYTTLC